MNINFPITEPLTLGKYNDAGAVNIINIARGTTDPEIDYVTKFGNHMAPLALAANLATRWRHLH